MLVPQLKLAGHSFKVCLSTFLVEYFVDNHLLMINLDFCGKYIENILPSMQRLALVALAIK